jgi:hypothetical protein
MVGSVRIGSSSAAWGDASIATWQLIEKGELDYLVGDFLNDVEMARLAGAKAAAPDAGHAPEWLAAIRPHLAEIHRKGIRLVTNAGGANPRACRDAFVAAAAEAGLQFRVAIVSGDDLMPMAGAIERAGVLGAAVKPSQTVEPVSINASLGAPGIVDALKAGADVVITGAVAPSALVLGPLMAAFSWDVEDYDALAGGSLAGHVVNGGPKAIGGGFTDWEEVADGWAAAGFPIVECESDGSFTVTKTDVTGGIISVPTVAEQIIDGIGDPQAFCLPDVCCDLSRLRVEQAGRDRIRVTGAAGRAPGSTYRASAVQPGGFKIACTFMSVGPEAGVKARRTAKALVARAAQRARDASLSPPDEVAVDIIGADAQEVVVRIAMRHQDSQFLEAVGYDISRAGTIMAPGVASLDQRQPKAEPVLHVRSFAWPKHRMPVALELDRELHAVVVGETDEPRTLERPAPPPPPGRAAFPESVPLRALAFGRSSRTGTDIQLGLIAREAAFYPFLAHLIDEQRVANLLAPGHAVEVARFLLPGLSAVTFVLRGEPGENDGSTLGVDPHGATYAHKLLDLTVDVPAEWLEHKGPLAGWRNRPETE